MQNLRTLRQRIRSVQATQKITKAMQMVAGAKLRRMQGELVGLRPFADRLQAMTGRFLAATPALEHPLLGSPVMVRQAHHDRFAVRAEPVEARTEPPIGLIVVTSDTGLCGTYNEHVLELAERFLVERPCAQVVAIGKKGSRFFGRRGIPRMKEILDWSGYYEPGRASELLDWLVERYRQSEVSGWAVAATAFISALRWKPTVVPLLPLSFSCSGAAPFQESPAPAGLPVERPAAMALPEKLIVEPDVERFAEKLIRRALEARFSRILLEAFTAEHSARMIAMKNATDNASEMIDHLTLVRNKARQASITKELIEVVSGAEALK